MTYRLSPEIDLPPSAVTSTFAYLGIRGYGKSYAAGVQVEDFLGAGAQVAERQLGTLAVMKPSGGTFGTYLSRLKTCGLVTREGGMVSLTAAGRAAAGTVKKPCTARELLDMWREKIPSKAADILEWLAAERVPKTKDELSAFSGLHKGGGTFDTYLSKLAANGLAVRTKGGLRAVEELWL